MLQENSMNQEKLKSNDLPEREYEKSGMYTKEGKSFRILALLGCLAVIVVLLAVAAAVLDLTLLER
jgi:multidrug efflux pump subunit AcrB